MYARVATFEGDPANVDAAITRVRGDIESGTPPPGLEGAKMLMLVNRETGKGVGITLFESEESMKRGDEALNAMDPGAGGQRTSVEFYEMPSTSSTETAGGVWLPQFPAADLRRFGMRGLPTRATVGM